MINDVQMVELNVLNVLAKGGHEICFSHSKCSKKRGNLSNSKEISSKSGVENTEKVAP